MGEEQRAADIVLLAGTRDLFPHAVKIGKRGEPVQGCDNKVFHGKILYYAFPECSIFLMTNFLGQADSASEPTI
jgi:hypothetical protein